jgi:hypothetical protein
MMYIFAFGTLAGAWAAQLPNAGQLKGSRTLAPSKFVDEVNTGISSYALNVAPGAAAAAAKKSGSVTEQPVNVQIDESVLKQLQKELSPKCGERYSAMLVGQGPQMHTFNRHGTGAATLDQCENQLEGKMCHTDAQITEGQNAPDGRKLSQVMQVEGNSCLPKECIQQSDLQALASFMRDRTKEMMPGEGVKVQLNVNCAKSGGGDVLADGAKPAKQELEAPRSSSFMTAPLFTIALALLMRF